MFLRILVAIDGSAHAARALREAVDIADRNNAVLTVMTVAPDPSTWLLAGSAYAYGTNLEQLGQETERDHSKLLDAAVARVPDHISVTKVLKRGRAAQRVLEQLEDGRHDLVVMGSRGRGEMRSLVLGSVSHQVLSASRVAVLIVRADGDVSEGQLRP